MRPRSSRDPRGPARPHPRAPSKLRAPRSRGGGTAGSSSRGPRRPPRRSGPYAERDRNSDHRQQRGHDEEQQQRELFTPCVRAPALPARPVRQGLRAGARRVLRHRSRSVGPGDHPAHHELARRARGLHGHATSRAWTTSTSGSTGSTSTCAWAKNDRLCVLVIVGVRTDGRKELVAISDGYRESTESWSELLRDCRGRGMRAPGARHRRRGARVLGRRARRVPRDDSPSRPGGCR